MLKEDQRSCFRIIYIQCSPPIVMLSLKLKRRHNLSECITLKTERFRFIPWIPYWRNLIHFSFQYRRYLDFTRPIFLLITEIIFWHWGSLKSLTRRHHDLSLTLPIFRRECHWTLETIALRLLLILFRIEILELLTF